MSKILAVPRGFAVGAGGGGGKRRAEGFVGWSGTVVVSEVWGAVDLSAAV